jgi:hypothetical protein
MKARIIFKQERVSDSAPPNLVFVEIHDENGKSISVGQWCTDGEYEALDIEIKEKSNEEPPNAD